MEKNNKLDIEQLNNVTGGNRFKDSTAKYTYRCDKCRHTFPSALKKGYETCPKCGSKDLTQID